MADASKYPTRIPPFGLRMPDDLKARVQAAAEANNRSMNAEIVATLEEKYPAPRQHDSLLEAAVADDLTAHGWAVELPRRNAPFDIAATIDNKTVLIEVKSKSRLVSADHVKDISHAARGVDHDGVFIVSFGEYSDEVKAQAANLGIGLIDIHEDYDIAAILGQSLQG